MVNKLYDWIKKQQTKDSAFGALISFFFKSSKEWLHNILNILLPLFATMVINNDKYFRIIIILLIVINLWHSFVSWYNSFDIKNKQFDNIILNDTSIITLAIDDYINKNLDGKGLFQYTSNIIVTQLYDILKKITGSETRISVIQQYQNNKGINKCVMISRKSQNKNSCPYREDIVEYNDSKYFYFKILQDNDDAYIYFINEKDIEKNFYRPKKKNKKKIYQYMGITQKVQTNEIAFLLQIDAMSKNAFGKSEEDLAMFLEKYISHYIKLLRHAYILERSIKGGDLIE